MITDPPSTADEVLASVVVPTYREAENLPLLVPRITAALAALPHEIIIVDDNSNDSTDLVVHTLRSEGHAVRLIQRTDQRGLSSAVLRGFADAEGRILVCMDADLSHPPETLPRMIEELRSGDIEFVIGSRYASGGTTDVEWGLFRQINSKVATLMARPFCRISDPMTGYFALSRDTFRGAKPLNPVGYKIGLELIVKCGCTRVGEIPIHFSDRRLGESKLSLREQINYLRHLKRLADFKYGGWSQLGQFLLVGASGMVVDLLAYALLLRANVDVPIARALAIFAALSWNFALNRRVSFSDRRFGRPMLNQYLLWLGSCGFGAFASWSVAVGLTAFAGFFALHPILAAIVGIPIGSLINFLLARHFVFKSPAQQ